jgi:hypothetical protein
VGPCLRGRVKAVQRSNTPACIKPNGASPLLPNTSWKAARTQLMITVLGGRAAIIARGGL